VALNRLDCWLSPSKQACPRSCRRRSAPPHDARLKWLQHLALPTTHTQVQRTSEPCTAHDSRGNEQLTAAPRASAHDSRGNEQLTAAPRASPPTHAHCRPSEPGHPAHPEGRAGPRAARVAPGKVLAAAAQAVGAGVGAGEDDAPPARWRRPVRKEDCAGGA